MPVVRTDGLSHKNKFIHAKNGFCLQVKEVFYLVRHNSIFMNREEHTGVRNVTINMASS